MLSKVYPELQYEHQKYEIDHFHNPYLPKLSIKFTTRQTPSPYKFISPLSLSNNIYVSQSIPIYKHEKFRFALIWRESISSRYAKAHFGFSSEYKLYESLKLKNRMMFGMTSLIQFQAAKYLKNDYEIILGYSGLVQNSFLYSSFNIGLRKGIFSAFLTKKINGHNQIKVNAVKEIYNGIYLNGSYECNVNTIQKGQASINLSQNLSKKDTLSLGIVANPHYQQVGVKIQLQHLITKHQKLLLAIEYTDRNSYLYCGFKNLNFNFVFPFMAINSPVPIILATVGFGLAYLYKKFRNQDKGQKQQKMKQKSQVDRIEELKVINDKSSDLYQRQKLSANGLLIQEAYIGPKGQLEEFMNNPNRINLLNRNQEFRHKFIDLTVTLRFYVSKGELKIRKGQKDRLLGFYRTDPNQNTIGIRYIKNRMNRIQFFDYLDPIAIVKE